MKKGRTRCKKLLCWLLVAAMVFTSGLSGLEVKAAGIAEVTEDTVEVSESTGESAQESEPAENSSEESERNTESAVEDDTESSTEETAENEESEAATESVTDETESEEAESEETETKEESEKAETEEAETEESATEENTEEEPIAYLDGTEEYGTLLNGDFESDDESGAWTYEPWTVTLSDTSGSYQIKQETGDTLNNATRYLNIWSSVAGSTLTVSQSVNNIKPGTYKASVQTAGDAAEGLTFSVKTENETLASASIDACGGWDTWNTVTTAEFTVEDDSTANLTIEISGTPENTGSWYIQLDNITLEEQAATYTKEQLQTLYAEHTKQPTATIKMWEA